MDPALLTDPGFWSAPENWSAEFIPPVPELEGHVFFQTSGSSGEPKWIALSKNALLVSAAAVNRHLGVTEDSRWGLALPIHHVGGFGVAARAFEAACDLAVFPGRWNAAGFNEWMVRRKITHTSLVPTQVHDLVQAGLHSSPDLAAIVVGGGRLDAAAGRKARELGWPVLASYGMTEAGSQIATLPLESLREIYQPTPIPLLPIWKADLTEDGLLRISGPALFSGTVIHEDGAWKFVPRAGEWHVTADRVAMEGNQLAPLGRADLRVKVLGELVDLVAIENELGAISRDTLAPNSFVVIAVPDERLGHKLVPVFESSATADSIAGVVAGYNRTVEGFRRLQPPVLIRALPRSALGKIRRGDVTFS